MMKNKAKHQLNLFGALLLLISPVFVSCSNEEGSSVNNELLLNGEKISITVGEEAFESGPEIRATIHQADTTIDMGNDIVAEMSIIPDHSSPTILSAATRTSPLTDGHYTIFVVDASGNRLTGTDKEISGTVTGGKFVPDHNAKLNLANGTYTFVCHNDAVVEQGGQLKVESNSMQSACPMIGTVTKTIGGSSNDITFTLKHYAARVKPLITTFTSYANMDNNTTTLSSASNGFADMTLSLKGDTPQRASSGTMVYSENNAKLFEKVGNQEFSGIVTPFQVEGGYTYIALAPGESIPVHDFQYNFNGKIYGKPVNHTFLNRIKLDPNYSYTIKLAFKSKDPLLLYQDGTVGYIGDKTTARVPVGVVTKEKTTSTEGTAMALKNAPDDYQYVNGVSASYLLPYNDVDRDHDLTKDIDGYNFTYSTSIYETGTHLYGYYTSKGKPFPPSEPMSEFKLEGELLYPMQHTVAQFSPGVPTHNIGKWFVATGIQWRDAFVRLAKMNKTDFDGIDTNAFSTDYLMSYMNDENFEPYEPNTTINWTMATMENVFTQSGGDFPTGLYNVAGGFVLDGNRVHYLFLQSSRICTTWTQQADYFKAHIRPFVHF